MGVYNSFHISLYTHQTPNVSLGIFGSFDFMLADHLKSDKQQLLAYDFFFYLC